MPYTPPSRSLSKSKSLKSDNSSNSIRQNAFHSLMNNQIDSKSNNNSKFYLMDDNSNSCESLDTPLTMDNNMNNNMNNLIQFTTESSQSYSYTPVSINSLTMRLNVLKRSLEILLENPDWLNSSIESFPDYNIHLNPNFNTNNNNIHNNLLKLDKNISSSTLQTLLYNTINMKEPNSISSSPLSESSSDSDSNSNLNDSTITELMDILKLLKDYDQNNIDDIEEKVLNLHNLSLSNISSSSNDRINLLKIKILHALATPFIEQNNYTTTNNNNNIPGLTISNTTTSTLGLSSLNNTSNLNTRQYHATSNAKTKSPKAVFTVSLNSPWDLLNANDLGLLMFGLSKSSLCKMKLMDLIAPRSRDLVFDRLYRNKSLIMSGEIIAVKRYNGLAWTSLWAKRKNEFIILIFEQVACETIDIIIKRDNELKNEFYVSDLIKQNNSLYEKNLKNFKLSTFLPSLSNILKNNYKDSSLNNNDITSSKDSNLINNLRYFTLKNLNNNFVPCAITSEYLNIDDEITKSYIRVNLHSLPYIAGSFLISSKDYTIKSFNEAIAKNLFGTSELKNQSIDLILPDFTNLLNLALIENPNLLNQDGLVLPEHYFRKLNSWKIGKNDKEREEIFINSKGINGKHIDGNVINVDIQLHISNNNYFLLWITFCRSFSNKVYHIEKLVNHEIIPTIEINKPDYDENVGNIGSKPSIRFEDKLDIHHFNDESLSNSSLPSQLKLFENRDGNNLDTSSQGSSSSNLSRSSSIKTINQSNISSPTTPKINRSNSLVKMNSSLSLSLSSISKEKEEEKEHEPMEPMEPPKINRTDSFCLRSPVTCQEHLDRENKELEYLKQNSINFPKVIGKEKRSKKFTDFEILKNLGQGAYGKVVFAQYKKDSLYRDCVKAIFKERILVDTWVRDKSLGTVPSEIQILYALNKFPHANIMRIIDFFEDDQCYYLETMQHGKNNGAVDLYDIIEIKRDMIEYEAKYIYFQIVAALNHMHINGIVHRDIKDENIIVDKDYFVKLIDFGSAAWVKDGPFGVFVGTIDYAAPEVLNGQPYEGKSQDVWAMGVLLYTLIFKENPFCSVDEILDGKINFPQYSDISDDCISLIRRILVTDVHNRPTMQDIMNDKWLTGFS